MKVGEFKSPSGLIRAEVRLRRGKIEEVVFTGDFFVYPEERLPELEEVLRGTEMEGEKLVEKIREFYDSTDIVTPALEPEHWMRAIEKAAGERYE